MHVPEPFVIAVAVLLVGSVAASYVDRLGAPTLLLFLAIGMLLGENGPGGIHFNDAVLARDAGSIALVVILLEGGLLADLEDVRRGLRPALLLATLGVVVTAGVVGLATHVALGFDWTTSLLLGAAVSSTDAAAVFSAIRGLRLQPPVGAVLEAESGFNDPFAAMLVIGLLAYETHAGYGFGDGLLLFAQQLAGGAVGGLVTGAVAIWLLRRLPLPSAGLAPVVTLSVVLAGYVASASVGGSGLLAAYLAGLAIGGARIPHAGVVRGFAQGFAWLAQLGLFVLLGLLVTPSDLASEGLSPLIVALVLVLVARPLAVVVCTAPFRLAPRAQAFIAWAGLRGGVPIVFATFPLAKHVHLSLRVFDVVFYVVVASVVLQGVSVRPLARRLGLVLPGPGTRLADLDSATLQTLGADLLELGLDDLGIVAGQRVRELTLPGAAVLAAIRRADAIVLPRGSTVLADDDRLYLLAERERLPEIERALRERAG